MGGWGEEMGMGEGGWDVKLMRCAAGKLLVAIRSGLGARPAHLTARDVIRSVLLTCLGA